MRFKLFKMEGPQILAPQTTPLVNLTSVLARHGPIFISFFFFLIPLAYFFSFLRFLNLNHS